MPTTTDNIGLISVPAPSDSGLTWPASLGLVTEFGYATSRPISVITHRFGELGTLAEQRFLTGFGPRRFFWQRSVLSLSDRTTLWNFYESVNGSGSSFTYPVPQADFSTTNYKVIFETPLTLDILANAARGGITFIECVSPDAAPSYAVNATVLRFPDSTLSTALLSQVQQLIPLIHVRVRETDQYASGDHSVRNYPEIYLSDRRCNVGTQSYIPRVIGIGDPQSDVLMTQTLSSSGGGADSVQFQFANADRVMTDLSNDTDLQYASIDLCLYHVQSGYLIQLWKGFISSFVSDGSPVFGIQCSDGLYRTSLQYPNRTITRQCWKTFDDDINCPFTAVTGGTVDSANFPQASPSSCDFTFNGPNGCQAHKMAPFNKNVTLPERKGYYGGHPANPQGVFIKDNSTGLFGFQRNRVTSVSIVSDTCYGQPIQEVWCNAANDLTKAFIVNAIMVDYRDESDFSDSLAIVSSGPILSYMGMGIATNADGFKYIVAPLVDGFTSQGFKVDSALNVVTDTNLGLRQVLGSDPADVFQDDHGNNVSPSFSLGQGTPQVWGPETAAGTAFVEMRIKKPSQIQPSTPDQHSMTVPINRGMGGREWDADGNPVWNTLTNPFWIAVNTFLRALGLPPRHSTLDGGTTQGEQSPPAGDSSAQIAAQLGTFVLSSVFASDGQSGTAQIADQQVTSMVDASVMEPQFQFQGVIAQQKPYRDWLQEILAVGLGYFTWEFGKLKLGCRENASATDAFTIGNMLFQSLTLRPIEPKFERLLVDFADISYQNQANSVEYYDRSHAIYYGRQNSPLTMRQHSVGSCTTSQSARIAAVRTREEIGGINLAEWRAARIASFKTTILALNTEVGKVISITHPDIPSGTGKFRIEKWTLYKDWSVQIEGKTVTNSMYDLTVGPKPIDVKPNPLPALFYPIPLGVWAPYMVQAASDDAAFPSEWTFDVVQTSNTQTDGSIQAIAQITGVLPVNTFIEGCGAPVITEGTVTQSNAGGSVKGGITLRVSICAVQGSTGQASPPSNVILIQIPTGADTNQFTVKGVVWPHFAGLTGYILFASDQDDLICFQQTGDLSGSIGSYTPTDITFTGPLSRSTYAIPNSSITKVRLKTKVLAHGGILGAAVDSVSPNHIIAAETIDSTGTDNHAGRILGVIGRSTGSMPYWFANITAFNHTTGDFTLDRDPTVVFDSSHPTQNVGMPIQGSVIPGDGTGDAFVVCMKGYDNSATPYVFADAGLSNIDNGHTGLTPHAEKGLIGRILKGTNRGTTAKVVDNDATSWTFDQPFVTGVDSIVVIEGPIWDPPVDTSAAGNANSQLAAQIQVPVINYLRESILIGGFTVDDQGNESPETEDPMRMCYFYGIGIGQVNVDASKLQPDGVTYNMSTSDQVLTIEDPCTTINLAPNSSIGRHSRWIFHTGSNPITVNPAPGDTIEGRTSVILQPGDRFRIMPKS